jgi:hypothetical protein
MLRLQTAAGSYSAPPYGKRTSARRRQLTVYQRSVTIPRIQPVDRLFWAWLSHIWSSWRGALMFVQPRTIIAWQRKRFGDHWARMSGKTKPGRPSTSAKTRQLMRRMSKANPHWGSPRIVGELAKIGIVVAKSTVEKHMIQKRKPPSRTWPRDLERLHRHTFARPSLLRDSAPDPHTLPWVSEKDLGPQAAGLGQRRTGASAARAIGDTLLPFSLGRGELGPPRTCVGRQALVDHSRTVSRYVWQGSATKPSSATLTA